MAKRGTAYSFAKRQKELKRQKKQEEKRLRKQRRPSDQDAGDLVHEGIERVDDADEDDADEDDAEDDDPVADDAGALDEETDELEPRDGHAGLRRGIERLGLYIEATAGAVRQVFRAAP